MFKAQIDGLEKLHLISEAEYRGLPENSAVLSRSVWVAQL